MKDRIRRIYVPAAFAAEISDRIGMHIALDGRTYVIVRRTVEDVTKTVGVDLRESAVPYGQTASSIEHWLKRGR